MKYLWILFLIFLIPSVSTASVVWNTQYGTSDFNTIDVNDTSIVAGNDAGYVYLLNLDGVEQWNLQVFPDAVQWAKITKSGIIAANASKNSTVAFIQSGTLKWRYDNKSDAGPFLGLDANTTGTVILATTQNRSYILNSAGTELGFPKPLPINGTYGYNPSTSHFASACRVADDGVSRVFCQIDEYECSGAGFSPGWITVVGQWDQSGGTYPDGATDGMDPLTWIAHGQHSYGQGIAVDPVGEYIVSASDWYTGIARVSDFSSMGKYTEAITIDVTTPLKTALSTSSSILGRGVVLEIINQQGSLLGYDSAGGTLYAADMSSAGTFACAGGLDGRMRIYNKNSTTAWVSVYTDGAKEIIYGVRMSSDGTYAYAARASGWITKYSVPLSAATQSFQLYNPHYVLFTVIDQNNVPIPNVNISAVGVTTTTSSWDWLKTLLAIPLDTIPIQNTSMVGATDASGSVSFLMFESVSYYMNFSKGTESKIYTMYPTQSAYTILFYPNQTYVSSPAETVNITSLCTVWGTSTSATLNLSIYYNDTSSKTTNVTAFLYAPLNGTYLPGKAWVNTNLVVDNFTIPNEWGGAYQWGVYAIKTNGENVTPVACGITTKGPTGVMVDLGFPNTLYYLWLSFILLMLVGGIFTSERMTPFGMVLVPAMAGFFYWFGWITSTSAGAVIVVMGFLGAFSYMKWRHRQLYGTGAAGSTAINIVIFMVLLQLSVGFVNIMPVWGGTPGGFAPTVSNSTYTNTWTVSTVATSVQGIVPTAAGVGSALLLSVTMVWNAILFIAGFIVAPYTLMTWAFSAFGVGGSAMANYISTMFGFGWWVAIMLLVFNIVYKPPLGTVDSV